MRFRTLPAAFLLMGGGWATAVAASPQQPAGTPPETRPLPGKGLAQHPFLYCGAWQNRSSQNQVMYIVRGGKVVWSYTSPRNGMISDCTMLSNGNIVFSRQYGASEITQDKKIVWDYDGPRGTEIHSAYPMGKEQVLIMQNGNPAKLLIIHKASNKVEKEIVLQTGRQSVHLQFRHIRPTKAGTFMVPHTDMDKVVEYSAEGKEIWSVPAPSAWGAVRLKNGNTLISGFRLAYVREVDPKGKTVWEILKDDLPGIPIFEVLEVSRLANGNTLINNCSAGLAPELIQAGVQLIEVTPAKKVVWALKDWKALGTSGSTQLLDQRGVPENGDLFR